MQNGLTKVKEKRAACQTKCQLYRYVQRFRRGLCLSGYLVVLAYSLNHHVYIQGRLKYKE
jgi:RecB family endonuclease NucS